MPRLPLLLAAVMLTASPAFAQQADCNVQITKYQKLLDNDLRIGFVGKEIYAKADADLVKTNELCKAGQNDAAIQAVLATKKRYGYPPQLQ